MTEELLQFWTVVIAAATMLVILGGILYHGYIMRKHNRLSVTPKPVFYQNFFEEDKELFAGLSIGNNGLGPAIIRNAKAFVDDTEFSLSSMDGTKGLMEYLGFGKNSRTREERERLKVGFLGPGLPLRAGEKLLLFGVKREEESKSLIKELEAATSGVRIVVQFESIYREHDTIDNLEQSQ